MSRMNGLQSSDILQMLIQVQEKYGKIQLFRYSKIQIKNVISMITDLKSDIFLAGHAMALFVDGTETSSIALSYAMFELARNSDVQEKLYENIVDKLGLDEEKWSADSLQDMVYLEAVLHESMRLHPPLPVITRKCTNKYSLPKNNRQSEGLVIEPGVAVNIPIFGIHM